MILRLTPTKDIFEEAQAKVYALMHRDSFPRCFFRLNRVKWKFLSSRFLISKDYKDALLKFGPITPDSSQPNTPAVTPSIDQPEPKYPKQAKNLLESQLSDATKDLLGNVKTVETGIQQAESFDIDLSGAQFA